MDSSFLNCQSWIRQKFSDWVLIFDPIVMVPTWEGQSQIVSPPELSRTDIYPLPCSEKCPVFDNFQFWFSLELLGDYWKFSQKKGVCWNRSKSMVCLHFGEALCRVFCFLPSPWNTETPWAQQQTALNELEILSDNIFVIKCLAVLIFHSLTAWFIASGSLPVETSTPVDC